MIPFTTLMEHNANATSRAMVTSHFDENDGSTIYELSPFDKKERARIVSFFLPSNMQYQDMVRNSVAGSLTNLDAIYASYNRLYKAAGNVLNKFLFMINVHNFVCFLQQFKGELEAIGIESCIPARNQRAKKVDYVKVSKTGIVVDYSPGVATNTPTKRRTSQFDHEARYAWFMKSISSADHDIKDSTIVIRTSDGSGPVQFFNCSEDSVKYYELDYLKSVYSKENKVNYMKVRPISFKTWKELPLEKKIGTRVVQLNTENKMKYTKLFDAVINAYNAR